MIIRPATSEDLEWIYNLNKTIFQEDVWSYQTYKKCFALSEYVFLVAENSELCGFAVGRVIKWEGEVMKIGISPKFQRQGIGFKLLNKLLEIFKKRKVNRVFLEVRESNFSAIGLYKKVGFKEVGRRKKYYRSEDALIMVLYL